MQATLCRKLDIKSRQNVQLFIVELYATLHILDGKRNY